MSTSQTTNNVLGRAAKVIESHLSSDFRRAERAMGAAEDIRRGSLLAGQTNTTGLPTPEAAANLLQCRFSWPTAEKIAAELSQQGLLSEAVAA